MVYSINGAEIMGKNKITTYFSPYTKNNSKFKD